MIKNITYNKKIFDMILDGKSRRDVADFLNQNDILTPSMYLKINTDKDTTIMKKWNPEMVTYIKIVKKVIIVENKEKSLPSMSINWASHIYGNTITNLYKIR